MHRSIGQILFVLLIAAVVVSLRLRPAATAPPVDEQQQGGGLPAAQATPMPPIASGAQPTSSTPPVASTAQPPPTSPLASVATVTTVVDSEKLTAIPTVHPQLVECCRDLERTILTLREIDGYTARWFRQVRIDDSLRDAEEVFIKIRHRPFSVYMEWLDGSQRVWYVEGRNDNKLVARKSHGFGSLRRFWRIPPESALAMKDSRYPITQLGVLKLAERLHTSLSKEPYDAMLQVHVSTVENTAGRVCRRHVVEFTTPDKHAGYARSEFHIDEETSLLVSILNHRLSRDGKTTELLEHYHYDDIQFDPGLTEKDFDPEQGG